MDETTYHLETNKLVSEGIKRIILERVDQAINDLVDPAIDRDEGVHDARKCFKRIRAILRLVRNGIGQDIYRRENICFRDCGRLLAPARDSFVMVETLDALVAHFAEELPMQTVADVRGKLLERYDTISRKVIYESTVIEDVVAILWEARERILELPIECEGFLALSKGLQRVYRRGRQAMIAAYADPHPEAFHEWRKHVKYLWYHLEILEMLWPNFLLDGLASELHQLSDYLGDDHDLAELHHTLTENLQVYGDKNALLTVARLIAQRRLELEMAARPLGERLYFDKPQVFIRQIAAHLGDMVE